MKILWLTEFYPDKDRDSIIGGVQARCSYVGNYLSKNSKLQVIEGVPKKWAKASLVSFLTRLLYFPLEIIRGLSTNFDLVEASNFVMYFPAFIISRIRNKPLLYWYPDVYLGSWVQNVGPVGLLGEFVERVLLVLGADHYIAISQTVKNKLIAAGINPEKISVIYCGVDFDDMRTVNLKKIKNKYDVVAVSRLVPYKRLSDLISATVIIKKRIKNIRIAILGKGSELSKLREQVRQNGLSANIDFIEFLHPHSEVLALISSGRVFCHPSLVEGFGLAYVEAMALGKPVVAAKIPVIEEITQNGKGSLLFEPKNVEELTEKLNNLLSDKKLYDRKSKEALVLAKNYDWEKISQQTEEVYRKLL